MLAKVFKIIIVNRIMNKRGLSHVEFIVSFILFAGFLTAGFYFFSPVNNSKFIQSSVYYTFNEITKNITIDMETINIVIDPEVDSRIVGIPASPENAQKVKCKTEGSDGESFECYFDLSILHIDRLNPGNSFVKAKFSEDFDQGQAISGQILNPENFTISSIEVNEVVSEKRVNDLISRYSSDYDRLKDTLSIPAGISFSFEFDFGNGNLMSAQRDIPSGLEVFSKEDRFEIIKEDGSTAFGTFRVRIW